MADWVTVCAASELASGTSKVVDVDGALCPVCEVDHRRLCDALTAALATERPRFVYTIPTFQNPTGFTLSQARRA